MRGFVCLGLSTDESAVAEKPDTISDMTTSIKGAVAGAALALFIAIPVISSADTISELQTRLQSLYAQLSALQGGGVTTAQQSTPASVTCPVVTSSLSRGSLGASVTAIQAVLIRLGHLSADSATGFYGPLTTAAVQKFQCAQGIVCSGSPEETGWGVLGPQTRTRITTACAQIIQSSSAPQTGVVLVPTQGSSSQTIQAGVSHSFSANPVSGTAPLPVVFRANGGDGTYYVDFGDGSKTTMSKDCAEGFSQSVCTGNARFASHTYTSSGTYTAVLTYAPACSTGLSCAQSIVQAGSLTVQVNAGSSGTSGNGSVTASPSSGAAPLSVAFVYAAPTEGVYYIDFGDGANAILSENCLAGTATGSANCQNNNRYFATHTYSSAGTYSAKVTGTPCSNSSGISCAQVIRDLVSTSVSVSSPVPTVQLTANGQTGLQLNFGETYTVAWSAPGFTSCTRTYSGTNDKGESFSGSDAVSATGSGASGLIGSYTLTCQNADGQSGSKTITITHNASGKCSYDVNVVKYQSASGACAQGAATLSCPSDPSYSYTPANGCEMSALQNKGWTTQTVSGPSASVAASQLASAVDAFKKALEAFIGSSSSR